jgi:iron-sulfur cluster assembly accessory protein
MSSDFEFTVTDKAAFRIADIIAQQKLSDNYFFRLIVEGGGCSGFQYKMDMDNNLADDDIVIEKSGIRTVIDSVSAPYLNQSTLDYETSLGGSVLKVINPNATSSCGCGVSFNIQD